MSSSITKPGNARLNITDLIEGNNLWVINNTPVNNRKIVCMSFIQGNGSSATELIPNTPHPIHLSNRLPKDTLISCRDLFRFISSGSLTVVLPEEAEAYYEKNPRAEELVNHAYKKLLNGPQPLSLSRENMIKTDANASTKQLDQVTKAALDAQKTGEIKSLAQTTTEVNPTVRSLVGAAKKGSRSSDDVIMDLMNLTLETRDFEYILAEGDGAIRDFAREELMNRR